MLRIKQNSGQVLHVENAKISGYSLGFFFNPVSFQVLSFKLHLQLNASAFFYLLAENRIASNTGKLGPLPTDKGHKEYKNGSVQGTNITFPHLHSYCDSGKHNNIHCLN